VDTVREHVPAGFERAIWRSDGFAGHAASARVAGLITEACACDACLRRAEADVNAKRDILFPQSDAAGDRLTTLA
jgi:hypothetical protein